MQAQPELMRQHQAYKAVRERLFNRVKPRPALAVLRDYDAHILAWRDWCDLKAQVKAVRTSSTISASFGPYASCAAMLVLDDDTDIVITRRSMKDICLDILQGFPGITLADIKGPRRTRAVVAARQECMYAIYTERADASFPMMGRYFHRDHTSILHSVHKIKRLRGDFDR